MALLCGGWSRIVWTLAAWLMVLKHGFQQSADAYSCSHFPQYQLDVLQELYNQTNGRQWTWQSPSTAGAIWNFSQPNPNPCLEHWQGINCTSGCLIDGLNLPNYNIAGSLPASLGQLNTMRVFGMENNDLHGKLPSSLSNWTEIVYFDIQNNSIKGKFPEFITTSWTKMVLLSLSYNDIKGTLPNDINNLQNLVELGIRSNDMTGTLPDSLTELPVLSNLYTKKNAFNGTIPSNIGNLKYANVLELASNNFTGTIPASLVSLRYLTVFEVYNNHLEGNLPKNLTALINLQQFSVYNNSFTGTIPCFAGLTKLQLFRADINNLEGTLPDCFENLPNLQIFNASANNLRGSLPASIKQASGLNSFDVSQNELTGNVNNLFTFITNLKQLVLFSNKFGGNIENLVSSDTQFELSDVDLSDNEFSGSLPDNIFQLKNLSLFSSTKNCFEGKFPVSVCQVNQTLQTLVLDGLHAQVSCEHQIFPHIRTYLPINPVEGTLPACLFRDMSKLQLLHISGNKISGSLPDVEITPTLQTLSLAYNKLTGPIPASFQRRPWLSLDLSFNKLQGLLDPDIYSFQAVNASINLENNRLSGTIPSQLLDASNISILLDNMFECDYGQKELPANDPHDSSYVCGSDAADYAIYAWLGFMLLVAVIVFFDRIVMFFCSNNDHVIVQSYRHLHQQMKHWMKVFDEFSIDNHDLFQFGLILKGLRQWISRLLILIVLGFVPIYTGLAFAYGTYTKQYAFVISMTFLSGIFPAMVLLVILAIVLLLLYSPNNECLWINLYHIKHQVLKELTDVMSKHKDRTTKNGQGFDWEQSIRESIAIFTNPQVMGSPTMVKTVDSDPKNDDEVNRSKYNRCARECMVFYRWYALLCFGIIVSVATAIAINMIFVFVISFANISSDAKQLVSVTVSGFKFVWNGGVSESIYYFLNEMLTKMKLSQSEIEAKRSLLLLIMMWLSIFNNIVVPLIAVAFVSPNCFYYAIVPSEPVSTTINFLGCTTAGKPRADGLGYYVDINCETPMDPYTISYDPPFSYSYQCTSNLLANFVSIYIYRYIFGGIIAPFIVIVLKCIQEYGLQKYGWQSDFFRFISLSLPRDLRPIEQPPEEIRASAFRLPTFHLHQLPEEEMTVQNNGNESNDDKESEMPDSRRQRHSSTNPIAYAVSTARKLSLRLASVKLANILKILDFSDDSDRSMCLYRYVIMLAADIAILIAFGTLFPPLAVVGCFTIFIRTIFLQLSLGRIVYLAQNQPNLQTLVSAINEECVGMSKLLMRGLFSLPFLLSFVWSWFLFDIWGDRAGWRISCFLIFGLPLLPLFILPLVAPTLQKYIFSKLFPNRLVVSSVEQNNGMVELNDVKLSTTCNPIRIEQR